MDGMESVDGIVYLPKKNDTSGQSAIRHTEKGRGPFLALFLKD